MTSEYSGILPLAAAYRAATHPTDVTASTATHSHPRQAAPTDDAVLVQACLAGDANAWHTLVERHGNLVYGVARRFGLSPSDAEDVFQEVFTIVFEHLAELRDKSRVSFWLYTITRRECLRLCRSNAQYTELDEGMQDVASAGPENLEQWERERLVNQALDRLDARSRELLQALFYGEGTPRYEEVSDRLGIPRGSIGPTRARLVKKLESILLDMTGGVVS